MNLQSNDFELFGLPERFAVERSELDTRWKDLQRHAHPDRHASGDAASQRLAMQWSVRVNEAYQRLKDPLKRAAYLCELHGVPIEAENNTAMPSDFLMQQMQWREDLEDAQEADDLQRMAGAVHAARRERIALLGAALDEERNHKAAAQQVRALMFIERFARDVEDRLDQLGQ